MVPQGLVLMTTLLRRFAWDEPGLRPLAGYFENIARPTGRGPTRLWGNDVYSPNVWAELASGRCGSVNEIGDGWGQVLM